MKGEINMEEKIEEIEKIRKLVEEKKLNELEKY